MPHPPQPVPIAPRIMRLPPEVPEPRLIAGKCTRCGRLSFPKRHICPDCFDEGEIEEIDLQNRATLAAYTVVRKGRHPDQKPQAFAYVDTAEGLRLFAPLAGAEAGRLEIGCPLELVFEEQESTAGGRVTTFRYRPT